MRLITRCPACGTMFKVVADQLKVSQGWVRCGQCAEVFDASAHLLPGDTPLPVVPPLASAPEPAQTEAAESDWAPGRSFADKVDRTPGADDFDPASWKQERQHNSDLGPLDAPPLRAALVHTEAAEDSGFGSSLPADTPALESMSFVRQAQRRAFWRGPLARVSLAVLSLLLLLALAGQWVGQKKDDLAALEPRWLPALQAFCVPLGCAIRAPRHIETLVIDSSSFSRTGPDAYRLSFVLKNNGSAVVEIPALEVTLTDTQDQAVVRRVLVPAEFGVSATTLAARAELAGVVNLRVRAEDGRSAAASSPAPAWRVSGYRLLAFYP